MSDNSENQIIYNFISKKAFELSYALCRISQSIENKSFAKIFEEKAVELLNSATERNINNTEQIILTLEYFVRLAEAINLIRQNLVAILIAELDGFKQYIKESKSKLFLPNIEISSIFETNLKNMKYSAKANSAKKILFRQRKLERHSNSAINSANNSAKDNSAIDYDIEYDSAKDSANYNNSAMDSAKKLEIEYSAKDSAKQYNSAIDLVEDSAINLEMINNSSAKGNSGFQHISQIIKDKEQNFLLDEPELNQEAGKESDQEPGLDLKKTAFFKKINDLREFRLKDLEDLFPDLSERTIRYYLSDLVSQGFIEKVGISGPNVLYRLKSNTS